MNWKGWTFSRKSSKSSSTQDPLSALNNPIDRRKVFLLVGPTGSGKSNFVEKVTGKTGLSNANLRPCTLKTSEFKVSLPEVSGSEICLVDTPGFGGELDGIESFKKIANWWMYMEEVGHELVGLLYFHDIAAHLWTGSHRMHLKCFQQFCEEDLAKLIFTTTMWDDVDEEEATRREEELKTEDLRSILEGGASVQRFMNSRQSAIEILSLRVSERPVADDNGNGQNPQPPFVPRSTVLPPPVLPPYAPHGLGVAPSTVVLPIPIILPMDAVPKRSQAEQRKLGNTEKVRSKEAEERQKQRRLEDQRDVEAAKQRLEEAEHRRTKQQSVEDGKKVRRQEEEENCEQEPRRLGAKQCNMEKRRGAERQKSEEEGLGWLEEDYLKEERAWAKYLQSEEKLRCEEARLQRQLIEELRSMRVEKGQRKTKPNDMGRQREDREQKPERVWERGRFQGQPANMFQGVENVTIEQATFTMVVNSQPDEEGPAKERG